jgi:hypothetical protein
MSLETERSAEDDSDIDIWFKHLTGRNDAADPAFPKHTKALRQAVLELDKHEASLESLDHDWEKLRFRMAREGLLKTGLSPLQRYGALAAVLVFAVAVVVLFPREDTSVQEDRVLRGKTALTRVLHVADPEASATRILQICTQNRVLAKRRPDPGASLLLDIDVPQAVPRAMADALKEFELELPAGQRVTLVIMRSP